MNPTKIEIADILEKVQHQLNQMNCTQYNYKETLKEIENEIFVFANIDFCQNRLVFEIWYTSQHIAILKHYSP